MYSFVSMKWVIYISEQSGGVLDLSDSSLTGDTVYKEYSFIKNIVVFLQNWY